MKANEAPENIYIFENPILDFSKLSQRQSKDDIEYIRTDAFIEKAVEYMITHIPDMHILGGSAKMDECIIKEFRNYMKGE